MGIQLSPDNKYIQELRKWAMRPEMVGDTLVRPLPVEQGGRGLGEYIPSEHPYPRMLFRAERAPGGPRCDLVTGNGYIIVNDEAEERMQRGQGYHLSQQDAIDAVHAEDRELATLAANMNYNDRKMTPQAQAEAQAVKETSARHLGEIPEKPIRRRVTKKVKA